MANATEFPSKGRIREVKDGRAIFLPAGTNYELRLNTASPYAGEVDTPIRALIRGAARKVYTVPSGGNFITPILGEPRIVQGRVLWADEKTIVVQGGANFIIDLPAANSAIDLDEGPIAVNALVNVTIFPGARLEVDSSPAKGIMAQTS
jgi:hypothetical protein